MLKTLVYIPRMFSKKEFHELVGVIPEDFDEVVARFWAYVNERLSVVATKVRRIYSTSSFQTNREKATIQESAVIDQLVKSGIPFQEVSDPLLLAETREWYRLKTTTPNQVIADLYEASLKETSQQIVHAVDQTLNAGELGVLLIDPNIQIAFPDNYRIIRMLPFNPIDYLNRQIIISRA